MEYLIAVVALIAVFFFLQYRSVKKAKKNVGQSLNFDKMNKPVRLQHAGEKFLIYFYKDGCSKCKEQKPIIENLKAKNVNVVDVNVEEDHETATIFDITGTPTMVIVNNDVIKEVFVGLRSEEFLHEKFKNVIG